ncbi:hypothetical protein NXW00_10475 [Bacteroides thetaiotaomicron]|nr:hypothetical protein [Bacteroides thetaiotaomicron]
MNERSISYTDITLVGLLVDLRIYLRFACPLSCSSTCPGSP